MQKKRKEKKSDFWILSIFLESVLGRDNHARDSSGGGATVLKKWKSTS